MKLTHNFRGFTLIETIIGMVVFSVAIILISTALLPFIGGKSTNPYFEARAAALGQSVMNSILARQYDQNSDPNGSRWRCGENAVAVKEKFGYSLKDPIPACSATLGPDAGETTPAQFNDVDDFIGCWGEDAAQCDGLTVKGGIDTLVGTDYPGFTVSINVANSQLESVSTKRITLSVFHPQSGKWAFTATREISDESSPKRFHPD
ncbi:MSHA biogenesis protein MshD [Veronia nyctiphanis]|uniref:MSHA biogenesis protein MshD n=1 Tax=Veronia nyctiphanis TaxID=1278244 RepID=A0A4Q0YNA2_9GAMM|nr:type II secretion system protein [Veronia nyctiphanis]RXJ71943.1 MSHA biogenesis protein MshD [Veronia nyctiphanis]